MKEEGGEQGMCNDEPCEHEWCQEDYRLPKYCLKCGINMFDGKIID